MTEKSLDQAMKLLAAEIAAEGIYGAHAVRREGVYQGVPTHTKRLEDAALRAIEKALSQSAPTSAAVEKETYAAFQQRRGRLPDLIEEAISIYDGFMKDDDYDTRRCLDRVIAKLESARDWFPARTLNPASSSNEGEGLRARNRCDAIFDHKWLDTECVVSGCQSLAGRHMMERLYEVVRHDAECKAIGGAGDADCTCDAVPVLRELEKSWHLPVGIMPALPTPSADSSSADDRDLTDTALLDALRDECWDLRSFDVPTGGGDADVAWRVVGHWQAEPSERVIAEEYNDDPRVAIRAALRQSHCVSGEGK